MEYKTRTKSAVTLFIIFLIPLLIISNGALMISEQVAAVDDQVLIMRHDFSVAGIPLINMDRQQVAQAVEQAVAGIRDQDIHIIVEDYQWTLEAADLGVVYDVDATVKEIFSVTGLSSRQHIPLVVNYDRATLKKQLEEIAQTVDVSAIDAEVILRGNQIEKTSEQIGKKLNIESTMHAVHSLLANGLQENVINVALQPVVPKVTTADIRSIDKHFMRFATTVNQQDENRIHNIRRAVELLHPLLIEPEETISFNQLAAPYTAENGYIKAPVFSEQAITDGIGGGVCQLSSTLFAAAAHAGLDFPEHHNHSRNVQYIPAGYDATVSNVAEDLKVYNSLKKNVYIRLTYDAPEVIVDVFGNHIDYRDYSLFIKNDHPVQHHESRMDDTSYRGELYRKWLDREAWHEQKIIDFYYPPAMKDSGTDRKQQLGFK